MDKRQSVLTAICSIIALIAAILIIKVNKNDSIDDIQSTEKITDSYIEEIKFETEQYSKPDIIKNEITETITTENTTRQNENIEDDYWLLRIGMCEAGGESVECIANVMQVVLNRVDSDRFSNNIYDVLHEKGQFAPVENGWINEVTPSDKCYEALRIIKDSDCAINNALYFESSKDSGWFMENLEYLFEVDNVRFYK